MSKKMRGLIGTFGAVAMVWLTAGGVAAQSIRCSAGEGTTRIHHSGSMSISHPEQWVVRIQQNGDLFIGPPNGIDAQAGVSCGVLFGDTENRANLTLERGTAVLLDGLRKSNPGMAPDGRAGQLTVGGAAAILTPFTGPAQGYRERVEVVTVASGGRFRHFVLVTPERDYLNVNAVFRGMLNTVRFNDAVSPAATPWVQRQDGNDSAGAGPAGAEYNDGTISFRYPRGWRVVRGNTEGAGYTFLAVVPEDGSPQKLFLRYHKDVADVMCGMVHREVIGSYMSNSDGGPWRQRPMTEEFDAGDTISTALVRFDGRPPMNIASTICSNGHVASIGYEYDPNRVGSTDARLAVMKTLSMGRPTLEGRWNSQGATLEFHPNGEVRQWFTSMLNESRGTYRVSGGRLVVSWSVLMSTPTKAVWDCGFALTGARLRLNCAGEPERVYKR